MKTIEQLLYAVRHDVPHKRDEAEAVILQQFKALEEKLQAIDDYAMANCDPEQIIEISRIIKGEE